MDIRCNSKELEMYDNTFYSTPFALESVSRRKTFVQGQTAATSCRVCRELTPTAVIKGVEYVIEDGSL